MRNILSFRRVIAQVGLGQDSCNRAMEPNVQIQAAPDPVLLVQNPFLCIALFGEALMLTSIEIEQLNNTILSITTYIIFTVLGC